MNLDIRAPQKYQLFVERAARAIGLYCYDHFLDLTVRKRCDGDMLGWCHWDGDIAWLEVATEGQSPYEIKVAIVHEMIHAHQHMRGDLKCDQHGFVWKGRRNRQVYSKQPWELEATRKEHKIADRLIHPNGRNRRVIK